MMPRKKRLRSDRRGSAAIEFAIAAPVLLGMIFGLMKLGIMFLATTGLQHAVDEGARIATIFPRLTGPQIEARIVARVNRTRFGLQAARVTTPTVTFGNVDGVDFADVSMSYRMPVDFILYKRPDVVITRTRRAYLP